MVETDICVYGGTSGGVIAAVQAARLGKSVVLLSLNRHLGGMTSGGLGWTDIGNRDSIGGLSLEFYRRVGQHYGTGESFTFEPHVAEMTFSNWLREYAVPVYFERRLASVTQQGVRLQELIAETGDVFRARMFIDATYEGDLMAAAGVTFTFGREGTNVYGESLNGIRPVTPKHQFVVDVDPYVVPGDPRSGLLPFITADAGGNPGEGDHRLQAYNFRLCLTQVPTNRIPIPPPANYDPFAYELLARYIQARVAAGHNLSLRNFLKIDRLPNGKTDINNNGAFSTDFIGMNYTYATNTWAERERLWTAHRDYIHGLLHFLATDPRVPAPVREEMNTWGLCRDEFQDTGGWPHQLYVREARRMVSDYVMQQHDCEGRRVAPDSIGLASYTMDSHNCQRLVQDGYVRNEGDVQARVPAPYPIAYRAVVPRVGECDNLFVTFAISASHIAFGSYRMEPVFMITSQSAATAAALALDRDLPVQQLPYPILEAQLLADEQRLRWNASDIDPSRGIVVDTEDATQVEIVGTWTASTSVPGFHGAHYLHDGNTAKGQRSVRFVPVLPESGVYAVYLRWTAHANRATNVPVTLWYRGGRASFRIDQTRNGGTWYPLGEFECAAGTNSQLLIETTDTSGYVIADAALWLPPGASDTQVEVFAADPNASEDFEDRALFTFFRSGNTAHPLSVSYELGGTATARLDYAGASGEIVIPAGKKSVTLTVTPQLDDELEGEETIVLTLITKADYDPGPLRTATAIIRDETFDQWRWAHFTPEERADPALAGETADPDRDGLVNLWECFAGLDPKHPDAPRLLSVKRVGNELILELRRHRDAAQLALTLETSTNLTDWTPATRTMQTLTVLRQAPYETLRFSLGALPRHADSRFWRVQLSRPAPAQATDR